MNNIKKPLLRGDVHLLGFIGAIFAVYYMINHASESLLIYKYIYAISLLSLLLISAVYHKFTWKDNTRRILQKLDHAAILLLIAGTMTPLLASVMNESSRVLFITVYWLIVAVAFLKIIFVPRKSKLSSAVFYITIALFPMSLFFFAQKALNLSIVYLILLGGFVYLVGSVFYAFKKPKFAHNIFGYHELFHFFVLIGAGFHYGAIYNLP